MKKIIFLAGILGVLTANAKEKIKVTVTYVPKAETMYTEAWSEFFAMEIAFTIQDDDFRFVADETFKSWKITVNSGDVGTVILRESTDSLNKWIFDFGTPDGLVSVAFGDFNDPRELYVTMLDITMTILNGEPDCNSFFSIWQGSVKEYDNIESTNAIATGQATNSCEKSQWSFVINKSDYDRYMMAASMFSSVAAMTVRGFQK